MLSRRLRLLYLTGFALAFAGCAPADGPSVRAIADAPKAFVGTHVRMKVTPVFWTAVRVSESGALAADADAGALVAVCAVNPQQVTQGLLVCARDAAPLTSVQARSAASQHVEGVIKTFARADLVKQVKATQGVDLIVSGDGLPLYLELEQPLVAASSAPTDGLPPPARRRVESALPSGLMASPSPTSQVRDKTPTSTGDSP